jgi:hypothetical protein
MWAGWMPILQPRGLMIPGQFGPTRRDFDWLLSARTTLKVKVMNVFALGGSERGLGHLDLVSLRNAFGDANNESDFILDRFDDGVGCVRGRDVEHGSVGFRLVDGLETKRVKPPGSPECRIAQAVPL